MDIKGKTILLIEDEESLRGLISRILTLEGFKVFEAGDVASAMDILRKENIYLIVTDVMLPDTNGIELTKKVKQEYPHIEVIVLTAFGNVKDGVRAMKLGAFDYIMKGDGDEKLPLITSKAMEKAVLTRQVLEMEYRLDSKSSFAKIIGKSGTINRTIELSKKVAVTDTTVLLLGETGTGKELLAEAIHLASRRRKGPFITINCAAIPKELQESELFGHRKGSFTGAIADKKGYLEVADRGTIFLDELGEMSTELQAKLLRALENRTFNRVGDTEPIPVDIRIIAATNRNLIEDENNFRKDLYYRLSTFSIELPPLRERPDDIDLLALNFLRDNAEKNGKVIKSIDQEFMRLLKTYHWPGNIRELKNVVERAVILADRAELTPDLLPNEILRSNKSDDQDTGRLLTFQAEEEPTPTPQPETSYYAQPSTSDTSPENAIDLKSVEQEHIMKVLQMVNGNKSEAAKRLDIGLATLYRKLKEYNLN